MKTWIIVVALTACNSSAKHAQNTCEVGLRKAAACGADSDPERAKQMLDNVGNDVAVCVKQPERVERFDKCLGINVCDKFAECMAK